MAGVPCFNDTCSTSATVDGNGRLSIGVNLDPDGGLECGTLADPNLGLRVNVFGDPSPVSPASLTVCDSLLGYTTDGELYARRPQYELIDVNSTSVDFGLTNDTLDTGVVTINNNAACPRLVIVTTKFIFQFTTDAADPSYTTDGSFVVGFSPTYGDKSYGFEIAGSGAVSSCQNFEAGTDPVVIDSGCADLDANPRILAMKLSGTTLNNFHAYTMVVTNMFTLPSLGSETIRGYGTDRTAYGTSDGSGGNNGFRAFHQILILDAAPANLA